MSAVTVCPRDQMLHSLRSRGYDKIAKLLHDRDFTTKASQETIWETTAKFAITTENMAALKFLLDDVHMPGEPHLSNITTYAVMSNLVEIASYLLEHYPKVDIDADTAFNSISNGRCDMVRLLLKHRKIADYDFIRSTFQSVVGKYSDMIDLYITYELSHGDFNSKWRSGLASTFVRAVEKNNTEIIEKLLQRCTLTEDCVYTKAIPCANVENFKTIVAAIPMTEEIKYAVWAMRESRPEILAIIMGQIRINDGGRDLVTRAFDLRVNADVVKVLLAHPNIVVGEYIGEIIYNQVRTMPALRVLLQQPSVDINQIDLSHAHPNNAQMINDMRTIASLEAKLAAIEAAMK